MKSRTVVWLLAPLWFAGANCPALPAEPANTIDNGVIRVGIDLAHGGSISFLADAEDPSNVINSHDLGRFVGQSYYSGPKPFGSPHPKWPNWPWNPVSAGDVYGKASKISDMSNDGKVLYTKSIPKQWALNDVDCECTFETWISLNGTSAHVKNRLVNSRSDKTIYPAFNQELPAVYTNGTLFRIVSYTGSHPFTQDQLTWIEAKPPPWTSWTATENWAAIVNNRNWGLGVLHWGVSRFLGGFSGTAGIGGSSDNNAGYLSPVSKEVIGPTSIFEYEYDLILGNLDTIRSFVYSHRPNR